MAVLSPPRAERRETIRRTVVLRGRSQLRGSGKVEVGLGGRGRLGCEERRTAHSQDQMQQRVYGKAFHQGFAVLIFRCPYVSVGGRVYSEKRGHLQSHCG